MSSLREFTKKSKVCSVELYDGPARIGRIFASFEDAKVHFDREVFTKRGLLTELGSKAVALRRGSRK